MGIDTSVSFGVGYEVGATEELLAEYPELEDYEIPDLIGGQVEDDKYFVHSTNCGYDTEIEYTFVMVSEPFKQGYDLTKVKQELEVYLKSIGLETYGEFDCVGGLMTY